MGIIKSTCRYIFSKYFSRDLTRICILGPLESGKTSLLFYFSNNQLVKTIQTIGFNAEEVYYKNKNLLIFDIGDSMFNKWGDFILESEYIFFVIDISSKLSIQNSKDLLYQIYFGGRFRHLIKEEKNYQEKKLAYDDFDHDGQWSGSENEDEDDDNYLIEENENDNDENRYTYLKRRLENKERALLSESYFQSVLIEQSESDSSLSYDDEFYNEVRLCELYLYIN